MIDRHGHTWLTIERWLNERRDDGVQSLINGSPHDDQKRGEIRVIDDLLAYASDEPEPVVKTSPDY